MRAVAVLVALVLVMYLVICLAIFSVELVAVVALVFSVGQI
jgi:hypothetical protein